MPLYSLLNWKPLYSSNKISSMGGYNNMIFIKFFVDSQAALMVLDKSNIRSIQVRDTCWALDKLGGWQSLFGMDKGTRQHIGK